MEKAPNSNGFAGAQAVRRAWPGFRLAGLVLCVGMLQTTHPSAQDSFVENPRKVEAAYLRNFARYVSWPARAFGDDRSPWRVGILGSDPFGVVLEKTFQGRAEQGRLFEIFRADNPKELSDCNIVFVAYKNPDRRRAALAELKGKPVLTVGESPDFLREGGIIQLEVGDRVKININLDQARLASLAIQTKMLEVADHVVENGIVRSMR